MAKQITDVTEQKRLNDAREAGIPWKKWGPYLSERQWGTVREDYSENGDAWNFFPHDHARSRAYRWGEDGLGGISDEKQRLCFALALWNGKDPILKERLFGLTNSEGNHGEDVKEYYFYLDSTPTHSYMKYLYKYPQREFPYRDLVETNRRRTKRELEYELLDTGAFADDRYFDVFLEYAKEGPEDILIEVSVHNRGPEAGRRTEKVEAVEPARLLASPLQLVQLGELVADGEVRGDVVTQGYRSANGQRGYAVAAGQHDDIIALAFHSHDLSWSARHRDHEGLTPATQDELLQRRRDH